MTARDARKAACNTEIQRQTGLFYEALWATARDVSQSFGGVPVINALASALAQMEGDILGGCPDRVHRKALEGAMDRARRDAARNVSALRPSIETINIGGWLDD